MSEPEKYYLKLSELHSRKPDEFTELRLQYAANSLAHFMALRNSVKGSLEYKLMNRSKTAFINTCKALGIEKKDIVGCFD